MVGEAKPDLRGKDLVRVVTYEKSPSDKETFKVIVRAFGHMVGKGDPHPPMNNHLSMIRTDQWGDQSDRCALGPSEDN
jgi:hypothetical protein